MNIFENYSTLIKKLIINNQKILNLENLNDFKGVVVESPPIEINFDLSSNIGLVLAKINKLNPIKLSNEIKKILLNNIDSIEDAKVEGPGFINIALKNETFKSIISDIFKSGENYGSTKKNKKYNIEFVSANPTGPMHVGHCRGAIYGDVLANLLKFNGNEVTKEYYINDFGTQIINFTKSVYLRIRELKYNEKFIKKEDLYPGDYVIDIAKKILKEDNHNKYENFDKSFDKLSTLALKHSMDLIKLDLKNLGIEHDNFFSEKELIKKESVNVAINFLKKNKFVEEGYLKPPKGEEITNWKKTKRLIFKSTLFGDDMDRALQKNDKTWTYFANDIAYHMNKVNRNYDYLINVLGADHTGYVKRITAAVKALSNNVVKLECKVCQLVKLYKNNKPFKMSKRAGDFISVRDLLNEVSKDSIRFMMLNRSNDVELDFDFDKVLEKSKDNPVFYVQYCNARISSLFRTLNTSLNYNINFDKIEMNFNSYEKIILRKIFEWPKIIEIASNKYEPHRISFYLYEVATLFHAYWSKGNEKDEYKFIKDGKIVNHNTILVIKLISLVVNNGMQILGVSLPSKM